MGDLPARRPSSEVARREAGETTTAVLNSTTLRVSWEPPELQHVVSVLGNVVVDYTDADWPLGITGVDCVVYLGNVEIRVPEDVDVEITGSIFLGSSETKGQRRAPREVGEERPLLSVHCTGLMGNVVVRIG